MTDGSVGEVLRIDRDGGVSAYATGSPPKAFQEQDIGGPVDVAFIGRTAYVLVTLVSGYDSSARCSVPNTVWGPGGEERSVSHRAGRHPHAGRRHRPVVDRQPTGAGVLRRHGCSVRVRSPTWVIFLVTDGHHNRVLWVSRHGAIHEIATFGNVVPTELATFPPARSSSPRWARSPTLRTTARSSPCDCFGSHVRWPAGRPCSST